MRSITRREIIRGFAALGALSTLAACGPAVTPVGSAPKAEPTQATEATKPAATVTTLTGAGATFPNPLYVKWFDEYAKISGVKVNYQAIGSGGGIQQHTKKLVDFGASDGILTEKQRAEAPGTLMIPTTAGAVALVVNLDGVEAGKLRLTSDTLAGIYLGTITKWDDPRIAADNAGLKLPSSSITVVRRADGSGTTNIFTSYLAAVSPDWKSKVGAGNAVQWPTGIGGEGNAGVAGAVKGKVGSIGYVELAYAKQNKLTWAALKNQSGAFVEPTLEATTAAMDGIEIPDSTEVMIVNSANAKAYPIAGFTWILTYENQADKAKAQPLANLLWWALHDGQQFTAELDYAPLSPTAVKKAEALVKSMKVGGEPALK